MTRGFTQERRRERRYEVELHGELRFDGAAVPVIITDLSASGALVNLLDPPTVGRQIELWIEDYGTIAVEVVHVSDSCCGLALANPAAERSRLLEWLRQEVQPPRTGTHA